MVCRDFILPEPASYVFFYAFFNLRNLLYIIFGLDCSGFVDWTFYNATNGSYYPGRGGGAATQHSYCTDISWSEAKPGDLVFYPADVHVGIVGGRDADGNLLIVHCSGGANGVVITGSAGFTSVARPDCFANES